jgi:serine/threonine protein kinase/Tfp pilus assembly protein PilF
LDVRQAVATWTRAGSPSEGDAAGAKGTAGPADTVPLPRSVPGFRPSVPGYEILEELGRGNMGVVYKARQIGLDRLVALKMIRAGAEAGLEELQRFANEARVVASLRHPNIVQLYEIDLQQTSPYFSMEFVEGGTLADRLGGRPQPFRPSADLVLTLSRAVHVAHEHGVVHRDLKPANIMLASPYGGGSHVEHLAQEMGLQPLGSSLGIPKITDFGLAKELHSDARQTESGMIMGTPAYMAPEQAEGRSRDVGPAADIYALGVLLYEMLTGRPPFTAESPLETVLLLFQTEAVPPSHLQPKTPRDLETICLKCLQKDPRRRYATAAALADDLQRFLAGEPILARPTSLFEKMRKWARRRPALATMAGCTALAGTIFLGLLLSHQVYLQSRLGQALEDEREVRAEQEVGNERDRLAQIRDRIKDLLHTGEAALLAKDWPQARLQATRAQDQADDEPELGDLQARIGQVLRQIDRQRFDYERLQNFLRRRNDAFLHATLFTGNDRAAALGDARTAALEALASFGATPGPTSGLTIESIYYSTRERAEIRTSCYELLLLVADVVAQPLPDDRTANRPRHALDALGVLECASRLGVTTQAYHRRRALYLEQAARGEEAERERRLADAMHPSGALEHFLLGQECYRRADYPQAILAFEGVLQDKPDHFWASYYMALCRLRTNRPDLAASCLTSCLAQRGDLPWLYLLRASAWGELGQHTRAEADFAAALESPLSDAARFGLLVNRGVQRIRRGQLDSAKADLTQAIALRPDHFQGYLNLAQAHLKAHELDETLRQLEQAVRCAPKMASLYRTRCQVHLLRRDETAALADIDRAIRLGRDGKALAQDHLERGRILHRKKDYQQALAAYVRALELQPRDAAAFRLRAEALLELGRLTDALVALDDCLKYSQRDAGASRARAALRTRLGQYAGAQADYARALDIEPDAATHAARGWCSLVADAPRLALPDFDEAIRLAPEKGDAYAGRGYCRALLGEYQLAVADGEAALRHGPPSPRLDYNVARIHAQASAWAKKDSSRPKVRSTEKDAQSRALLLLTRSLAERSPADAARFWRNVVHGDKALDSLRRSGGFIQLETRYSRPRAATTTH